MSLLAFFDNVFHHGGQPVPIELSISNIPEDGKDPDVICLTVDHSNLLTTPKDSRTNRGKFCLLAQGNRGLIVVNGSDQRKMFEKPGLFTINLEMLPYFRDLNDCTLPDHLLDEVRYIKNFTKRALPLTNRLRKDTPFEWTCETQAAFDDIKEAILNPPVLALPDPDAELQITTDVFSHGIDLSYWEENSKFLQIINLFQDFFSNKNPSSKILRWKLALEEFNYDIHYIRGSLNSVADHLPRCINNITIALPVSKDLIKMQHEDPVLSPIIQKIDQNNVSPQVSNYFINGEGLLCHLSKRPSRSPRSNTTRKQVCIPHCLKAKILESVHSEYGGHLKFFKTYHRLSENFFWQNMYKDTKNFVRSCTICLPRKNAFKIPPAPHQPVEQSQEPGETCHIDIFGPLKTTSKAHVNKRVEKPNQSLANILASITQNTNDWDEQLPHTMLALNSVIHEATNTSLFFLEHGTDIGLSYTYQKGSDTPQNKYEYVEKLLPSLEEIFQKVLQNLKEQEASHINLSTRATKPHHYDYKIGSLCFIKMPHIKSNLSPKLRPKFEGPYRVVERFSNVNYIEFNMLNN
ncbi:integrase catalytic domain-containing protein [Trichonephila clavipes]|nr:integrase catalytic domain-containing protein [Trichonephila clavipes]